MFALSISMKSTMTKTLWASLTVLAFWVFSGSVMANGAPLGCPNSMTGDGSWEAPCQITDWDDLAAMNATPYGVRQWGPATPNCGDGTEQCLTTELHYQLMNNLRPDCAADDAADPVVPCSAVGYTTQVVNGGTFANDGVGWRGIPVIYNDGLQRNVPFVGSIRGDGYVIDGIKARALNLGNPSSTGTRTQSSFSVEGNGLFRSINKADTASGGLTNSGIVKNLKIEGLDLRSGAVSTNSSSNIGLVQVGGLAGVIGDATISDINVSGAITHTFSSQQLGGLAGAWTGGGAATNVVTDVTIGPDSAVANRDGNWGFGMGGLIGMVGVNQAGTAQGNLALTSVGALGDVQSVPSSTSGNTDIGGLIGFIARGPDLAISQAFASGAIQGGENIGGLFGSIGTSSNPRANTVTLTDVYTAGTVANSRGSAAGLIASAYSDTLTITNAYAGTAITSSGSLSPVNAGLIRNVGGANPPTITNTYWDIESTGSTIRDLEYGTPTSVDDMVVQATFENWDFTNTWQIAAGTYPYLRSPEQNPPPRPSISAFFSSGGDGSSEAEAIHITNWTELNAVRNYPDLTFVLTTNLDKTKAGYADFVADAEGNLVDGGKGWKPIEAFTGTLLGIYNNNQFGIEDLKINRPDQAEVGLIAKLGVGTDGAAVKNLVIKNSTITGRYLVGGLAANVANSTISNSAVDGVVITAGAEPTGTDSVPALGGLVGSVGGASSVIDQSYANADVRGLRGRIGGLVGSITSTGATITNSYAVGLVSASGENQTTDTKIGGLVGQTANGATVDKTYASVFVSSPSGTTQDGLIGDVATASGGAVTNSFWDTDTSKITAGTAGTPKTATELTDPTTFSAANWDTSTIWFAASTNNFPYLRKPAQSPAPKPTALANFDDVVIDPNDPEAPPAFAVSNWTQLNAIRNFLTEDFALTNDLGPETAGFDQFVRDSSGLVNGGAGWLPIGEPNGRYSGIFDGRGFTISGLEIDRPSLFRVGLFRTLDSTGVIKNLTLENANVSGGSRVGGLVAEAFGTLEAITVSASEVTGGNSSPEGVGGVVGVMESGSEVTDVKLQNSDVTANSYVGGLVGTAKLNAVINAAEVTNTASSTIAGNSNVGGVVGVMIGSSSTNRPRLLNSSVSGYTIELRGNSPGRAGGLVGWVQTFAEIVGSRSEVTLQAAEGTSPPKLGGIAGEMSGSSAITKSSAKATITGENSQTLGGLVGAMSSSAISESYAEPNILGSSRLGGLVGEMIGGTIENSYSALGTVAGRELPVGAVAGDRFIGGLVGWLSSPAPDMITNSYAANQVTGEGTKVGGLLGGFDSSVSSSADFASFAKSSYWDTTYSDIDLSATGEGQSLLEMLNPATYVGWDKDAIWTIDGVNYPYLQGNSPASADLPAPPPELLPVCPLTMQGNGGALEPCQITNWTELAAMATQPTYNYILMNDLDASSTGYTNNWSPIGVIELELNPAPVSLIKDESFSGQFDGNDKKISGLVIDRADTDSVGLFGAIGPEGIVKDLEIVDATIEGKDWVGIVAGMNFGTITNVAVSGVAAGNNNVGGIAGRQGGVAFINGESAPAIPYRSGLIEQSAAEVVVSGVNRVGGLIGQMVTGQLLDSSAMGDVTGAGFSVGGAIGETSERLTEPNTQVTGYPALIEGVSATGDVSGEQYVGGLIGQLALFPSSSGALPGEVSQSFATGAVTATLASNSDSTNPAAGGLVGYVAGSGGKIKESFATGAVTAARSAGGLVGSAQTSFTVEDSYATGSVTVSVLFNTSSHAGSIYGGYFRGASLIRVYGAGAVSNAERTSSDQIGPLVGRTGSSATNSFWSSETVGSFTNPVVVSGSTGLNLAQMLQQSSFTNWDFTNVWQIDQGQSFPYLRNAPEIPSPKPVLPVDEDKLAILTNYDGTGDAPTDATYLEAGVIGVTSSNVTKLNEVLVTLPTTDRETSAQINKMVAVFTEISGGLNRNLNAEELASIGLGPFTGLDPNIISLTNSLIRLQTSAEIDAELLQAIGTLAQKIITSAKGTGGPAVSLTAADLALLQVDSTINTDPLADLFAAAVGGALPSEVNTQTQLAQLATAVTTVSGGSPQPSDYAAIGLTINTSAVALFNDVMSRETAPVPYARLAQITAAVNAITAGASGEVADQPLTNALMAAIGLDVSGIDDRTFPEVVIALSNAQLANLGTVADVQTIIDAAVTAANTFQLTVTNGSPSGAYVAGRTVTVVANSAPEGFYFSGWTPTTAFADATLPVASLIMPTADTEVTANYAEIPEPEYTLTVAGGTGSGSFVAGTEVTISANAPADGDVFTGWTGGAGLVTNPTQAITTVIMSDANLTVTANYEPKPQPKFALNVTAGTGSGEYEQGDRIGVAANPAPEGKRFDRWQGDVAYVANVTNPNTEVTMPGQAVLLVASYADIPDPAYALTITGGVGGGTFKAGAAVTISANAASETQVFDRWLGDTAYVANVNDPTTTVTMPSAAVSLRASFKAAPETEYALTVSGGAGSGNYVAGDVVTISAGLAPSGQVFDRWSGQTARVANVNQATTTITMPTSAVTVTALYKALPPQTYTLTVNQGTGDGEYTSGRIIGIAADPAPSGSRFERWVGQIAGVANVNQPNTTLTMPASAVSISAQYAVVEEAEEEPVLRRGRGGRGRSLSDGGWVLRGHKASARQTEPEFDETPVAPGTIVFIEAPDAPDGFYFDKWIGQTAYLANIHQPTTSVLMPNHDVTVLAQYRSQVGSQTITLAANIVSSTSSNAGSGAPGTVIELKATPTVRVAGQDFIFDVWEGQTATVGNVQLPETTVTVPDTSIALRAVYQSKPSASTAVKVGSGDTVQATPGTYIPLTSPSLSVGQGFTAWIGQTATVENTALATTRLYIADTAVTLDVQTEQSGDPEAIGAIIGYDGTGTAPNVNTYEAAGVTGVDASNVGAINSVIAALGGVQDPAQIGVIVTVYNAVLAAATANEANLTVEQYQSLGITLSTAALPLMNNGVAASNPSDVDDVAKLKAIADGAGRIATLAAGGSSTPTGADYQAIGIDSVVVVNASAYNSAIAATQAATPAAIQAVVSAYNTILAAATQSATTGLTAQVYSTVGVTVADLAQAEVLGLMNSAVAGQSAQASNTVAKLQAMATGAARIISTASTSSDTGLTAGNFNALGIDLVDSNNIVDAIALIESASVTQVQTVPAIEALLVEILTPPLPVPVMPLWAVLLMALGLWLMVFRGQRGQLSL